MKEDKLIVAKKKFNSRLIVGTGKYKNMSECAKAIKLSGADIVTVAVRRVNIFDKKKFEELLLNIINDKDEIMLKIKNLEKLNYQNTWNNVNQNLLNIINEN